MLKPKLFVYLVLTLFLSSCGVLDRDTGDVGELDQLEPIPEEQVSQAFGILLADPQVKRILVNVFGGILRCDVAARGIVSACKETEIRIPIVVRMLGTNADEGKDILASSGLTISLVKDLKEAASVIKESAPNT